MSLYTFLYKGQVYDKVTVANPASAVNSSVLFACASVPLALVIIPATVDPPPILILCPDPAVSAVSVHDVPFQNSELAVPFPPATIKKSLLSPKPALPAELSECSVASVQDVPFQPSFLSPAAGGFVGGAPATHLADVPVPPVAPPYLATFKSPTSVQAVPLKDSVIARYAAGLPYPPT